MSTSKGYRSSIRRKKLIITLGLIICFLSFLFDIMSGTSKVSAIDVYRSIFDKESVSTLTYTIVRVLRLPTSTMALLVGSALGLSGAVMQTILNNAMASPYTLGISAGAGVGASICLLTGLGSIPFFGNFAIPFFAFLCALISCFGIFTISKIKGFTSDTMVLSGIGMVFFFQAVQSFLQYKANAESLQAIVFWTFGSLNKANKYNIPILAVVVLISFIIIYRKSWMLTAMRLGDAKAKTLGVPVEKLRFQMFVLTSMMTATAVAFVGSIGFIGIVGPHIARMLVGEDHLYFLPMSAVCGAGILSVASLATKIIVPGVLYPIGILTSMIGVPFFFALILRKRRSSHARD